MNDTNADFEKADMILAETLERFINEGVSPFVYGMALMEIGIAALAKAGEDETSVTEQAGLIAARVMPAIIGPR